MKWHNFQSQTKPPAHVLTEGLAEWTETEPAQITQRGHVLAIAITTSSNSMHSLCTLLQSPSEEESNLYRDKLYRVKLVDHTIFSLSFRLLLLLSLSTNRHPDHCIFENLRRTNSKIIRTWPTKFNQLHGTSGLFLHRCMCIILISMYSIIK